MDPIYSAERKVLDELLNGLITKLGNGRLPSEPKDWTEPDPERALRASFVRWLALGGDGETVRLHEKGLRIRGALIVDDGPMGAETCGLDLEGCVLDRGLGLGFCRFQSLLLARGAQLQTLHLQASHLPDLSADGLETRGRVFLRQATVKGETRLLGARIGVDLVCEKAQLFGLRADGLESHGTVFLRQVTVKGETRLIGARIGGGLECDGAQFLKPSGMALSLDGAQVTGHFFLRDNVKIDGDLDLTAATFGAINDDEESWPSNGCLHLNRCQYGAFVGKSPVDATARKRWLALQDPSRFGADFWPQPYEQCAKVLREMGHAEDAKDILIEKERLQRADRRLRETNPIRRLIQSIWDPVLGATVRYGQRPLFAVWWLLGFWVLGYATFAAAYDHGAFKPNNAFILRSPEWVDCARGGARRGQHPSQLACFLKTKEGAAYPAFNPGIYALDVLVPLVEIDQQAQWTPDTRHERGPFARGMVYVEIVVGWALSLLAVAGFSGLVKSD